MSGSLHLRSNIRIDIEVHRSWFLLAALLAGTLSIGWLPRLAPGFPAGAYWLAGICASVLLLGSLLARELGHVLAARIYGLPVRCIVLFFCGGITILKREPESAWTEGRVAAAGPVVSLLLAVGLLLVSAWLIRGSGLQHALVVCLGLGNLVLALFTLLPSYPMDGGRMLHAILWRTTGNPYKAKHWAAASGQVVAVLFLVWALALAFVGDPFAGLWTGLFGWFLFSAAHSATGLSMSESLIGHVSVAEAMNRQPVAVPVSLTLQQLYDEHLTPSGLHAAAVVQHDHLLGLVTLSAMRRIPAERWESITVGHAMLPLERLLTVEPDQRVHEALSLMAAYDLRQLPVARNGRLEGMIGHDALARFLQTKRGLSPAEARRQVEQRLPVAS